MEQKLGLYINGRRFDIDVKDEFATFLQAEFEKDFNINGNNDIKILLQAYVKKNYQLFEQDKKIKDILQDCETL